MIILSKLAKNCGKIELNFSSSGDVHKYEAMLWALEKLRESHIVTNLSYMWLLRNAFSRIIK